MTFAFVTFRLVEKYLLKMHFAPDTEIDSFMAFASWAVPLLLAEALIQWRCLARCLDRATGRVGALGCESAAG